MADYVQVLTTVESREDAYQLAHQLVDAGHAALVQIIGPVVSIYRHDGVGVEAQQWQLLLRTMGTCVRAIEDAIQVHLAQSAAEIIVMPIVGGNDNYLKWIEEHVDIVTRRSPS
jgi:periplasmic divalent cation tolerance protein